MKIPHIAVKSVLAVLSLTALNALCSAAHASTILYRFTMTVDSMFEHDGATNINTTVQSSTLPGTTFAIGYQAFGTLSFNTETPLSGYQPPSQSSGSYQLYSGGVLADLHFVDNGWQFVSNRDPFLSLIQVANNASSYSGWDVFSVDAGSAFSPTQSELMTLLLFDSTGTALSTSELSAPQLSALSLPAFSFANLDYGWLRKSDGSQMHASGRLTSLEVVTAVPAPATGMLLIAGAMAMVFLRSRATRRVSHSYSARYSTFLGRPILKDAAVLRPDGVKWQAPRRHLSEC
jgi:hypothetical protein